MNLIKEKDADILLVIPPPFFFTMPHLGIGYLAATAKAKGFKVGVADLSIALFRKASPEIQALWQIDCLNNHFFGDIASKILSIFKPEIDAFADEFLATDIRSIGFSVNVISIAIANEIARSIKERDPSRLVIFGGPAVFFKRHRILITPSWADVYCIGEAERTLTSILEKRAKNERFISAAGLIVRDDLAKIDYFLPDYVKDLDTLPFPTYEEFDLSLYNPESIHRPLPLLFSRGCIRHCTYCVDCMMWPQYRYRSAKNVIDEIAYHMEHHPVRSFEVLDLACNGNLRNLEEICDGIIGSGLDFKWVSYALIRDDMTSGLFSKMKKAGCHTLIYGVENGADKVLKLMGKPYTAEQARSVICRTHDAGIRTNVNIIVGFPGETEDDFRQTLDFVGSNREYIDEVTNVSACSLFPDSALGRYREQYGVVWQEGMDPMIFRDSNGLDRAGRHDRVVRLAQKVAEFGIANPILNKPALNPEVAEHGLGNRILRRLGLKKK